MIRGEPIVKKYTKIIDGVPVEITEKQTREERIITGPEIKYTRISAGGGETEETLKKLLQEDTPVKKVQASRKVQGSRRRSREGRSQ